jgi:hypothetical protein
MRLGSPDVLGLLERLELDIGKTTTLNVLPNHVTCHAELRIVRIGS